MKNPPYPGLSVRMNCLEPLSLTVSEGAKVLGVSRTTLSRLISGKTGISPEMAIRLSKAFGSSPGMWIRLQAAYDIAQAQAKADGIHVERYSLEPPTATWRSYLLGR